MSPRCTRSALARPDLIFGAAPGGPGRATFFANLAHDAPDDIANILRNELDRPGRSLSIAEVQDGPPSGGVEIFVTGSNYDDISAVSTELVAALSTIDGIVNLESSVSQARDEISIQVDPEEGLPHWAHHAAGRLPAQPVTSSVRPSRP